jgi:hypothetical protein
MVNKIIFEELTKEEKILLLSAYDYDITKDNFIIDPNGNKIPSQEIPSKFLKLDEVVLTAGSLNIMDGTPTSISKFIREKVEQQ